MSNSCSRFSQPSTEYHPLTDLIELHSNIKQCELRACVGEGLLSSNCTFFLIFCYWEPVVSQPSHTNWVAIEILITVKAGMVCWSDLRGRWCPHGQPSGPDLSDWSRLVGKGVETTRTVPLSFSIGKKPHPINRETHHESLFRVRQTTFENKWALTLWIELSSSRLLQAKNAIV